MSEILICSASVPMASSPVAQLLYIPMFSSIPYWEVSQVFNEHHKSFLCKP